MTTPRSANSVTSTAAAGDGEADQQGEHGEGLR